MRIFKSMWAYAAVGILVAAGAVGIASRTGAESGKPQKGKALKVVCNRGEKGVAKNRPERSSVRVSKRVVATAKEPDVSGGGTASPMLNVDDAEISEEFRKVILELQESLGADDKKAILSIVQRLLARIRKGENVPELVKVQAVRALASCGPSAASELVGFMADASSVVEAAASNAFEEMLIDADGDGELSALILSVVPAMVNEEAIDGFLSELTNMRSSVRVKTALALADGGNDHVLSVLNQNLHSYFGDCEGLTVNTREDIVTYGKMNPDGEDDEMMYGKWQNESDSEEKD